jgi:hypothetical protein
MQKGGQITFKDKKFMISVQGHQIMEGYQEGNLFWIDTSNTALHAISNVSHTLAIWHERMGHMSLQALKCHKDSIKGITLDPSQSHDGSPCPGCELWK